MQKKLILFDGSCLVCNKFIDFVIKNDKSNEYYIIDNSTNTIEFLKRYNIYIKNVDSLIVIDKNNVLYYSDAAINIISNVRFSFFRCFKYVPKFLRDNLYKLFAKNRKRFQEQSCAIPSKRKLRKILSIEKNSDELDKILTNIL